MSVAEIPGFGSVYFFSSFQDADTVGYLQKVHLLCLKNNKLRSQKTVGIKIFKIFFPLLMEGFGSGSVTTIITGPGGPKLWYLQH
jgi:hypothetical protein